MSKKKTTNQNNPSTTTSACSTPSSSPTAYKSIKKTNSRHHIVDDDNDEHDRGSRRFGSRQRTGGNTNLKSYIKWLLMLFILLIGNKIYFNYLNSDYDILINKNKQLYSIIKKTNYEHIAFASFHTSESSSGTNNGKVQSTNVLVDTTTSHIADFNSDLAVFYEQRVNETQKSLQREAQVAVNIAITLEKEGKFEKAEKIYKYALSLDPKNVDALTHYGEYLEHFKKDIIKAEHLYTKVVHIKPGYSKAVLNLQRTLPLVEKIDREMLDNIDMLLKEFYDIPVNSPAMKRAKREAYFMHVYHSNAIEGNTLNLQQTRHILESRMAINGKSVIEHQEVIGLDAAMRYLNETLLYKNDIELKDILEIHRRVLGFVDPIEAGTLRTHQVYVGNFVPPSANEVYNLLTDFIEWLNVNTLLSEIHPIQIAALAHYKFVWIHPFYDGNGRTARLLMNLILMKSGYPPIIIRKEERMEYYDYLQMANEGDVKPFIRFIARSTQRTLNEYILLCKTSHIITTDSDTNAMLKQTSDEDNFRDRVIYTDFNLDFENIL